MALLCLGALAGVWAQPNEAILTGGVISTVQALPRVITASNNNLTINMANGTTHAFRLTDNAGGPELAVPCPAIRISGNNTLTINQGIVSCVHDADLYDNLDAPVIEVGAGAKLVMNGGTILAHGVRVPPASGTGVQPDIPARGTGNAIDAVSADSVKLLGGLVRGGVSKGPVIKLGANTVFNMAAGSIVRDTSGIRNNVRFSSASVIQSASTKPVGVRIMGGTVVANGDSSAILHTAVPVNAGGISVVGVQVEAGTITANNSIAVNHVPESKNPATYTANGIVQIGAVGGAAAVSITGVGAAVNAKAVHVFAPLVNNTSNIFASNANAGGNAVAILADSVVVNARLSGAGVLNIRGAAHAILAKKANPNSCDNETGALSGGSDPCPIYPVRFIANEGQNPWNGTSINLGVSSATTAGVLGDVVKVESRDQTKRSAGILIQNAGVNLLAGSDYRVPQHFLYSDSNVVVLNSTVSVPVNAVAIRGKGNVFVTLDPVVAMQAGRSASVTSGNASAIIADGNVTLTGATITSSIASQTDGNNAVVESLNGYIAVLPHMSRWTTVTIPAAAKAGVSDAALRTRGTGFASNNDILTAVHPMGKDMAAVGAHDIMLMGACSISVTAQGTAISASANFFNTLDGLKPNDRLEADGSHLFSSSNDCYGDVAGCNNSFAGGGVRVRIMANENNMAGTKAIDAVGNVGIFNADFRAYGSTGNTVVVGRQLSIFDADTIKNTGVSNNAEASAIRLTAAPPLVEAAINKTFHTIKGRVVVMSALGAAVWNSGTHGIVISEGRDGTGNEVAGTGFIAAACSSEDEVTRNVNCPREGLIFMAVNTPQLLTTGAINVTFTNNFGVITTNGNVRVNAGAAIRSSSFASGIKTFQTGAGEATAHVQILGGVVRSVGGSAVDASAARIDIFGGEIVSAGAQPAINLPFKNIEETSGVFVTAANHSLVTTSIRVDGPGTASAISVGNEVPVTILANGDQCRVEISVFGISAKGILAKTGDVKVIGMASAGNNGASIVVGGNGGNIGSNDAAMYSTAAAGIATEGGDVLLMDASIDVRGTQTGGSTGGPTGNAYGILTIGGGDIYVVTSAGTAVARTVIKAAAAGSGVRAVGDNSVVWIGNNHNAGSKWDKANMAFNNAEPDMSEVVIEVGSGTAVRTDRGGVGIYRNAYVSGTTETTVFASDSVNVYGIVVASGGPALIPANNAIVAKRVLVSGNAENNETPATRGFVIAGNRSAAFVNAGEATSVANAIRMTGNGVTDSVLVINGGRVTAYGAGAGIVTASATSLGRVAVGNGDNEGESYGIVEAGTGGRAIEIGAGDVFVSVPGTHVRILGQRSAGNTITTAGNVSVTGGR
ncbi:MAG: hypothetical protein FWB94_08085, partial [Chitinispirillia bacterium]|nr:hypothetical protein [Chitinispirillia bacterium]